LRHSNQELLAFKGELEALRPQLHRIEAPTLLVHGTLDDLVPFANVAYMQQMLTSVGQLHVESIEGGDHFLPWNAKAIVRRALAKAVELAVVPS
jgi:pimeloyl-ACP methyl ester carboxylesterase